jgi:hypothetical protein
LVVIDAFTIPLDEGERLLSRLKENARITAREPGIRRATLLRAVQPEDEPRFISDAGRETRQALVQATARCEFRSSAETMLSDLELHGMLRHGADAVALACAPAPTREKPAS